MLTANNLHAYQERAVDFSKYNSRCALFLDCGLGKTIITLTALVDLLDSFEIYKTLIVAPLRVASTVWQEEAQIWSHCQDLSFSKILGNPAERKQAVAKDADIYLINYENLPWLIDHCRKDWKFDVVVFDEFSKMKSSKAKRFKAFRKVLPDVDRVIGLTGTPASNGLLDLWAQVFLLDQGQRLGKTYSGFRTRYFESDYMGFNFTLRPGSEAAIHQKLSDICLTLTADDYLTMPERIDNVIPLTLNAKARKTYRELEKDCLLLLEEGDIEATTAAVLTNKLLQFCNGAVYTTEKKEFVEFHEEKLDALTDIIEEAAGSPVLVAYNFQSDLARIKKRFPNAETLSNAEDTINRWNDGQVPLLLAHPASAGHGLNLQKGGHIVVWFGLNWSLELYQQFNARLYRQGQTKPVIIHHLVIQSSIDDIVIDALENKNTTQQALLDALKDQMLQRVSI